MRGPALQRPPFPTLAAALEACAGRRGGVTFVGADEREQFRRWDEIITRAARAAAAYAALGVKPGDRIGIVLKTEPAFLDAFFGAWLAAAVPVPLPSPTRLGHLGRYLEAIAGMVEAARPVLLVANGTTRHLLGSVVDRTRPTLGCIDVATLGATPARIRRSPAAADLGLVQFAWGPAGGPRPVAFTHAALAAQVAARVQAVALGEADVLVSWLSVSHDTGLVGCLLTALSGPGSLVLVSREGVAERPALWLRAVARHRGTVTVAPASAYGRCAAQADGADLARCALDTLRLAVARAEPGAVEGLRRFADRFEPLGFDPSVLEVAWSMTDPALSVTLSPRGRPLGGLPVDPVRLARDGEVAPGPRELADVGRPLPGVEVEVRDDAGRPLPDGRLGRLWVRAPEQLAGTEAVGPQGWLDTGDLGFTQGDELYLHARHDELVLLGGARHAPEEFEAPLHRLAGLGAVVAVTLPRPQPPSADGALLVLAERATDDARVDPALEAAVRRTLLERTGVAPHTVRILAPGSLPRTGSGRLRRAEAQRRFAAGTLAPPRGVNPVRLALDAARSQLAFARLRLRR